MVKNLTGKYKKKNLDLQNYFLNIYYYYFNPLLFNRASTLGSLPLN